MDKEETNYFTSLLRNRKVKKGDFLLRRGETARYDSYVDKGCLKASFIDKNGEEHVVQFAEENSWITDYDSFTNSTPSNLEIVALVDSELLQIEHDRLAQLFERIPKFERFYRLVKEQHYISLYCCLISLLSNSAEERYQVVKQKYPMLINRIPQHQIASFIGISPEYLSRIRSRKASL
ncbi:MAG: Crp/Fnr family transcriptional regulator [Balneolaceae bacterium]|nr:Crp/Fnr family transcriptional regulator [Balneolaceae bacterium]